MAELKWTTEALDWLEEIYRYIAQDNPQRLRRWWMAYTKWRKC